MNTDNQPMPDDGYRKAWQQAFNEADDTPPPRVWNAIERQLDSGNRVRVIPLWAHVRPWVTGVAAAVAFVLTGWWAWRAVTSDPTMPLMTHTVSVNPSGLAAPIAPVPREKSAASIASTHRKEAARSPESPEMGLDGLPIRHVLSGPVMASARPLPTNSRSTPSAAVDSRTVQSLPVSKSSGRIAGRGTESLSGVAAPTAPVLASFGQTNTLQAASFTNYPVADEVARFALAINPLVGKVLHNRQPAIERVVWFRNDEPVTETVGPKESKPAGREKWASLSIMPSSFSPDVTANVQAQPITTNAYLAAMSRGSGKLPALHSESGRAVTVQLSAGAQLNRRWSVETGVGYMQAQSTVVSPVLASALTDPADQTLYTAVIKNALHQASPAAVATNSFADKNYTYVQPSQYDTQTQGRTRNDYSFVQVPVQVGYQLRPRRKLGLAVLGGLLTNLFVRNAVGETLVVKPSDSVYRSLTLAGTAGARLRYRSSRQWSASVAGVYQQALQSGTQSDGSLETRPHTVGVSFGMDYHF